MGDRSPILQISNHHAAGCGTPPRIEERPGQYLGYFENGYGEQMVFVNSMSDLFHEDVPLEFIQEVFDVMRRASWHVFQVLTKRSGRLLAV